jgi:hypothetical protein
MTPALWVTVGCVGVIGLLVWTLKYQHDKIMSLTESLHTAEQKRDDAVRANGTLNTSVKAFEAEAQRFRQETAEKQKAVEAAVAESVRYRLLADKRQRDLDARIMQDMAREECSAILDQDVSSACPNIGDTMKEWGK